MAKTRSEVSSFFGSLSSTDVLFGYRPGVPDNLNLQTALSQVTAYLQQNLDFGASPLELLYYDTFEGSDITGSGTIQAPFLTYEFSRSTAVIKGASSTKPFGIIAIGIANVVGDVTITPFVNLVGQGGQVSQINATGNLILDASWNSISNPSCIFQNCTISCASYALSFSVYQGAKFIFDNVSQGTTPVINISGSGTTSNSEVVIFKNCINAIAQPILNAQDVTFAAESSNFDSINGLSVSSTCPTLFEVLNCPSPNNACSANTSGSQSAIILFFGTPVTNGINLQSSQSLAVFDASSYGSIPNLSGGATIESNIILFSLCDGVAQTSFTPVNYTPIGSPSYRANTPTGNFAGIDAKLASILNSVNFPIAPRLVITSDTTLTFPLSYWISGFFTGTPGTITLPNNCNDPSVAILAGYTVYIENGSADQNFIIKDSTATIIAEIPPQYTLTLELNEASTPQGEWFYTLFKTAQYPQALEVVSNLSLFDAPEFTYVMSAVGLFTLTLPSTFKIGTKINIVGDPAGGGWVLAQNSGQAVNLGSISTTRGVSGNAYSIDNAASISLVATKTNTDLTVVSGSGNFQFT